MKILIAGLGSIGRRHFRNLVALGEAEIVLYRTGRSTLPDEELAGFPVETDLQRALDLHPDVVVVSNPTALHLEVAIPAARRGCHLLLEKPVSHDLSRVDELRQAVQSSGSRVLVGYQFRFHPGLLKIKELLSRGDIGKVVSARAHWGEYLPAWHPWEDYRQGYSARPELGGGVVLTLSHPLDYLRFLFGEVEALWAFTGRSSGLDLPVEDTAEIGLRFRQGVLGSVHLDYIQRPPEHRLEIIAAEGALRWDSASGNMELFTSKDPHWMCHPAPPGFERNDLFLAQMKHFLEVARGAAKPVCSLDDGIRALELALAVNRSSEQGRLIIC